MFNLGFQPISYAIKDLIDCLFSLGIGERNCLSKSLGSYLKKQKMFNLFHVTLIHNIKPDTILELQQSAF